jgi:hypothetical protein
MTTSRLFLTAIAATALAALVATPATAQSSASRAAPLAWVGCWEPMDAMPSSGTTCIVPTSDLGTLRVLEVAGADVKEVSRLVLDGSRQPVTSDGCSGWESARLAADGGRILLSAEVSCNGLPAQMRSGAFVITPRGDWLHVQGSGFDDVSKARVRIFRESTNLVSQPQAIRQALGPVLGMAEATRSDLAKRKLDARDLLELRSLGVASPVIDVVVAAGFPKTFMLDAAGSSEVSSVPRDQATVASAATRGVLYPGYYGYGYPSFYPYGDAYGMCSLSMWGMYDYSYCARTSQWSRYGYAGYGGYYGLGSGFGSGWIPGYGYGGGVVVVVRPRVPEDGGGRVVKGQGYTRNGGTASTTGGTAEPRTRATPASANAGASRASGGSSAGSSSGSSNGSASTGSSSGSGRTAQPRKP